MLFERTALSRKPARLSEMKLKQLREEDKITPDSGQKGTVLVFFFGFFINWGSRKLFAEKEDWEKP